MDVPTVLTATYNASACEPAIALLRNKKCRLVVISSSDQVATIAESDARLIVVHGPYEFCVPFFRGFGELRATRDQLTLLVIAAKSSETFAIAALRAGAADYLTEPLDLAAFSRSISRWVPDAPILSNETTLSGGEVLVGNSSVMHALRNQIRRMATTDCNVLVTGETGTGKELVAELIHKNSKRSAYPFVCINCAAIPDSLLESELFGYERGAFTGATSMNQGKLMTANKGTVFFDEIGDLSPYGQAKILRAIETKEVQRLGATRKYKTDVRILAATHHNLDELAGTETFRRDLYFRLNVGRIHIPPLRERKTDITGLVDRLVTDLNHKLGRHIEGATKDAMGRLLEYDWPGNVRELKNVIERIFINRDSGQITEEDLPTALQQHLPENLSPRDQELRYLREALALCNGNKSKAAERLKWSRMTLYRKLAKYKLGENPRGPNGTASDLVLPEDSPSPSLTRGHPG